MYLSDLVRISRAYNINSAIILNIRKEILEGNMSIVDLSERHKLTRHRAFSLYKRLKKKPAKKQKS